MEVSRTSAEEVIPRQHIAIIGAGFSGAMTAVQLLRQARHPLHVTVFERNVRQLGRGLAYSTPFTCHLLNVPAGSISALPEEPDHFLDWAKKHRNHVANAAGSSDIRASSFLPRRIYGKYVGDLLHETIDTYVGTHIVEIIEDEIVDVEAQSDHVILRRRAGGHHVADQAVLTIGNFPPGDPPTAAGHGGYYPNPWREDVLPGLLRGDSCLMIGSGLTMLDLVMSLRERGYQGVVHVVSRRGLMPQVHAPAGAAVKALAVAPGTSLRQLTREIRRLVAQHGGDWRAVVDALRPHNPEMWRGLSYADKLRFIRHVRPYWENHRHRSAPALHSQFQELIRAGFVHTHQGRVADIRDEPAGLSITLRNRDGERIIHVQQAVNCTGAECNFRKLSSELIQNMLTRRLIACDPIGFGILAMPDGALLDPTNTPSKRLFTMGPPMKGTLWETTAVPELRQQAAAMASKLLGLKRSL